MARFALALALVCSLASEVHAMRFCIQLDEGTFAGSQIVLRRARLAPGNVDSLEGYFARYSPSSGKIIQFNPIYGASIVNSAGDAALALTFHDVFVTQGGRGSGSVGPTTFSISCGPGPDGKLNVLDTCTARNPNVSPVAAHVVDCVPETAVP